MSLTQHFKHSKTWKWQIKSNRLLVVHQIFKWMLILWCCQRNFLHYDDRRQSSQCVFKVNHMVWVLANDAYRWFSHLNGTLFLPSSLLYDLWYLGEVHFRKRESERQSKHNAIFPFLYFIVVCVVTGKTIVDSHRLLSCSDLTQST